MLPRQKIDSDPVATATMERIGRSLDQRSQPHVPFSVGFLFCLGALIVMFGWLAWPRGPSADPLGDARLNNARATPTPVTPVLAPRAELVRLNPNVPRAALVSLGTPSMPVVVP